MGYPANPTMKLYITKLHFILQTPDLGTSYQFIIERDSGRCFCTSGFNPLENGAVRGEIFYIDIFLIVGVVPIDSILYLLLVTEANIIDTLKDHNIYEVKRVKLIPISNIVSESEYQNLQIQEIYKLLSSGFYFSYYYDLTQSYSQQKQVGDLHERADRSFYWNFELYRDLINQGVDTQWFTPIIQGYIGITTVNHSNETFILVLISRRSCDRTGTRYNCRGLDDEGNVANYVETEQIISFNGQIFSYVQVRGSIPLFWEQTGMSAQVSITRSREMNEIGLRKHSEQMLKKFNKVTMINLLSNSKAEEALLKDTWEELNSGLSQVFENKVFYFFFDFHSMCKGNRFSNITSFIFSMLQDYTNYYMFYMESDGEPVYNQKGVMRTNCLDCLDRTNVFQSYLGWSSLALQMQQMKFDVPKSLDASATFPLVKAFKNLWADNGDMLSLQYTGTGSTISSVIRQGKQGFKGIISHGMRSLGRFYNANVEDAARQKGIDSLLRKRGDARLGVGIEKALGIREAEFTEYLKFTIRAVTWNLAGRKIPQNADFTGILIEEEPADIIFITFEEIVKLNPRNVLQEGNNQGAIENLKNVIERSLFNTGHGYSLLCHEGLVGLGLFIYAKKSLCSVITKLETDAIRVGFGGKMGNKGGVAGRFNIYDTSICILGCHLESGNEQNEARKSQILDIHNRAFQQEKVGKQNIYHISQHDIKLICGDLNFRIPLNNLDVRKTIKDGNYKVLIKHDQLTQALVANEIRGYNECEINFPPTYKYDFGTDIFDTSKKQRVPAWCDRVLYSGDGIEPVLYNSIDIRISDHRPVCAEFKIVVRKVDEKAKRLVEAEIYAEIEQGREEEPTPYRKSTGLPQKKPETQFTDLLSL